MYRNVILIASNSEVDLAILNELLKSDYDIRLYRRPESAISYASEHHNDIALIISAPRFACELNNYSMLHKLKENQDTRPIPILLLAADKDDKILTSYVNHGATSFIFNPIDIERTRETVTSVIKTRWGDMVPEKDQASEEEKISEGIPLELASKLITTWTNKLNKMFQTRGVPHKITTEPISTICAILTREYAKLYPDSGLTAYEIQMISMLAPLSDAGKIFLPDNLLLQDEYDSHYRELYKKHTLLGGLLFSDLPEEYEPFSRYATEITLYHHENFDGSGYPAGIKGNSIPLSAQLVTASYQLMFIIEDYSPEIDKPSYVIEKMRMHLNTIISPEVFSAISNMKSHFNRISEIMNKEK